MTDILENAANLESVTGDDESPAEPLLVLARTDGGCTALFVNEVVVAEANTTAVIDRLVVKAAQRLSFSLGVPLVECTINVPDELDGIWEWSDLYPMLPLEGHPLANLG